MGNGAQWTYTSMEINHSENWSDYISAVADKYPEQIIFFFQEKFRTSSVVHVWPYESVPLLVLTTFIRDIFQSHPMPEQPFIHVLWRRVTHAKESIGYEERVWSSLLFWFDLLDPPLAPFSNLPVLS